ncbi:YigZ family protein [Cutibacterium sp. WCA-380-WT-3A]|uniref:YigZ family protein n=1 Tax=Cutibacterium porci TaxID=2605781 RepID=A0A7K0J6H5_9ACTN|nr:YigZ family protein [Cutibacterium porci]MSS45560.1 YigZ family protein [Cutibacterium porci]
MNEYSVLAGPVEATIEIKRSVFLTRLVRVTSEDEAREVIDRARHDGHDARHHVFAFLLGPHRQMQRCSDDGEPAGTAGMPTLTALAAASPAGHPDLSDVVAVTSRWFGGIKLGAGGLTRAYGNAVGHALASAEFHRRIMMDAFTTTMSLRQAGHEEGIIRAAGHHVTNVEYTAEGSVMTLTCRAGLGDQMALDLSELLGRDVNLTPTGQCWADV